MRKKIHPDSKLTINKVKLTNFDEDLDAENQMTGLELGYTEELINDEQALDFVKEHPGTKLRNFLTHDDLIQRFEALRPHMALICEYHDAKKVDDDYFEEQPSLFQESFFEKVFVTQVALTGHDENSGVVLTGFRLLADGSKLNLNTPNLKFEYSDYKFRNELSEAVDELTAEAMLALTERKRKIVQADLFEDEGATDDEYSNDLTLDGSVENLKATLRKGGVKILVEEAL